MTLYERMVQTMKYSYLQLLTMDLINKFEPLSEYDNIRKDNALTFLQRDVVNTTKGLNANSGIYGSCFELLNRSPLSKVTRIQDQNKADIKVNVDGVLRACEIKTNAGRVGEFFNLTEEQRHNRYVVYTMGMVQKRNYTKKDGTKAPDKEWYIKPFIMRMDKFVNILIDTDGFKFISHNNSVLIDDREESIKQYYKPFYKAIKDYEPTLYIRGKAWNSSEIK